jgi:hypothetical protein
LQLEHAIEANNKRPHREEAIERRVITVAPCGIIIVGGSGNAAPWMESLTLVTMKPPLHNSMSDAVWRQRSS